MFGDRLKLARKRAGLSLRALSDQLGGVVSAQAIGKYERGEMMPGSAVLMAFCKVLDVPLGYFMSTMEAELDGVDFRKHSRTSVKERARVEALVLDQVERYLTVETILELDSANWDRPFDEKRSLVDLDDAEVLANDLRQTWDLGRDPIPSMAELLEEHGIKVLALPLPESVSGLTCMVRRPGGRSPVPVIVVNENHSLERRRLTMGHELAHRVIDPDSTVDIEKAANRFAGAFLMSRDHLLEEVGRRRHSFGYRELIDLKRLYRVSAAALLVRLEQTGVISQATMVRAFQTVARGWRKEEPEPLEDNKAERPKRFERLCYRALVEGLISLSKAAELLRKPVSAIRSEVRGPRANDNHGQ